VQKNMENFIPGDLPIENLFALILTSANTA